MLLPVGDSPNPTGYRPWVTWLLIAMNIAIYIVVSLPLSMQAVSIDAPGLREFLYYLSPSLPSGVSIMDVLANTNAYDLFIFNHGYKPGAPSFEDLLFSLFLHGGFLHLFGNMLFLWIYGDNVEHRVGHAQFLVIYIVTGIIATLFFSAFASSTMTPLVGASGAISGILGLYFLMFPKNKIKMFVFLFPFIINVFLIPARIVLGFYILIDNILPFLAGTSSGVAYGAHIGGFLSGMIIAWAGERVSWNWPWRDPLWRIGNQKGGASLHDLKTSIISGDSTLAVEILENMDRCEMAELTPDECIVLSGWLENKGHPIAASQILKRCISCHENDRELSRLFLELGLLRLRQGQPTAAFQFLMEVFEYDPDEKTRSLAVEALEKIDLYRRGKTT